MLQSDDLLCVAQGCRLNTACELDMTSAVISDSLSDSCSDSKLRPNITASQHWQNDTLHGIIRKCCSCLHSQLAEHSIYTVKICWSARHKTCSSTIAGVVGCTITKHHSGSSSTTMYYNMLHCTMPAAQAPHKVVHRLHTSVHHKRQIHETNRRSKWGR